jgi:ABC-type transporter Mla subunit MlaD
MEQQGQRQERLLQVLSGLPEALNTLPEATRNQTQALQALHEVLRKQGEKEGKLAEALQSVAHAQEKQDRSLGIVHTQLNVQGQTTSNMVEGLKSINSSLGHLSDRNEATARSLSNLADQTRKQDDTVRALFERNQRQITVMSVVSWTLAIVALTIAAAVAVSLGRLASGAPTSSVPTANASNVSQP